MGSAAVGVTVSERMIPLVVLTGFLGAGKTTLLNSWLQQADDTHRVAVIENEFGPVAVDEQLVANRHDQMPTLTVVSGCVCCSGAVDLVAALEAIGEWADERLKAVVVETTGMADVGPVLELLRDPDDPLASQFGPVVCVCVVAVDQDLQPGSLPALTWAKQLAFADKVKMSKLDGSAAADVEERTRLRIAQVNPMAEVFTAMELELAVRAVESVVEPHSIHLTSHDLSSVTTFVVDGSLDAVYNIAKVQEQLAQLAMWRVKGIVNSPEGRFLCQGVGSTVVFTATELTPTGLVVIHQRDLLVSELTEILASCCACI